MNTIILTLALSLPVDGLTQYIVCENVRTGAIITVYDKSFCPIGWREVTRGWL